MLDRRIPERSLSPWQTVAVEFLAQRPRALLADKMRVGKTGSAIGGADRIGAFDILWLTRGAARVDHAEAWRRFSTITRPVQILESRTHNPAPGVNIASYELAAGPLRTRLARPWDLIVLDESHRLKNRDALRTKAIYGDKCQGDGLVSFASHVWCLSGTPALNHPAELWPMLSALFPSVIPGVKSPEKPMRYWSFVAKYCTTKENYLGHVHITGGKNLADLKARMAPFVLRRSLEDIMADAPRLTVEVLRLAGKLELPEGADVDVARVNAALDRRGVAGLAEVASSAGVLRRLTGLAKVKSIAEWVIERLEDNTDKLVLFAHHVEVVESLRKHLHMFNPVALYGGSTTAERREAVPTFQNEPACRLFIGNLDTAGEAIDLSVADELLFAESGWTPGVNEQAAMRIVNVNKKTPTLASFATVSGSYDERVQQVCADKLRTLAELFA